MSKGEQMILITNFLYYCIYTFFLYKILGFMLTKFLVNPYETGDIDTNLKCTTKVNPNMNDQGMSFPLSKNLITGPVYHSILCVLPLYR